MRVRWTLAAKRDLVDLHDYYTEHPRLAEKMASSGLGMHVWTVNTEADLRRCQELGVLAVITDRPAYILQQLGQ